MVRPTEDEEEEEENKFYDDDNYELHTQNAASNDWEEFFKNYQLNGKYYYTDKIQELAVLSDKTLLVRSVDLIDHDYYRLFNYIFRDKNVEMNLRAMTDAVRSIYKEFIPLAEEDEIKELNARLSIDDSRLLEKLSDINIDLMKKKKMIVFNCLIVSQTQSQGSLKRKVWQCKNCDARYMSKRIYCSSERCLRDFKKSKSIHLKILESMIDFQIFEVQERQIENPDSLMTIPKQLTVKVYGKDLVDRFKAGDHIQVIGFPKPQQIVSNTVLNKSDDDNGEEGFSNDIPFNIIVEAHHIQLVSSNSNEVITDPSKILSSDDIRLIQDAKKKYTNKQITEKLRSCFAYTVYENNEIKDMLIWQSVGSVPFKFGMNETIVKRDTINIIIIGDPGTAKTDLLRAATRIHTKSMFTTGKGASGVGLTASIDTTQKGLNKLRIGAVVLADGGLCCCDEFTSITDDSKDHLLQCMENGIININKNGINVTLNARTAILAACNPEEGKYNSLNSLTDNVELSQPLWSRFDCITVIRDRVDKKHDRKLAKFIFSQHKNPELFRRPIDDQFLSKWLIYARSINKTINFTAAAEDKILDWYDHIRKLSYEYDVAGTPRNMNAMMRISIAHCRTLLENTVTGEMVDEVINNLKYHYETAGMISAETGGLVQTAQYATPLNKMSDANAVRAVMNHLAELNQNKVIEKEDIILELKHKADWPISKCYDVIYHELDKNHIIEVKSGFYKLPSEEY